MWCGPYIITAPLNVLWGLWLHFLKMKSLMLLENNIYIIPMIKVLMNWSSCFVNFSVDFTKWCKTYYLFTQDIVSKIINLSQQGPMKNCVHSATGGIRNVALQESAMGGGIVTYEVCIRFSLDTLTIFPASLLRHDVIFMLS